jgi:5'-nucleotidase
MSRSSHGQHGHRHHGHRHHGHRQQGHRQQGRQWSIRRPRGIGALIATTALVVTALGTGVTADGNGARPIRPEAPSVEGVRVLITNDDGVQPGSSSQGVFELRRALCTAGADVAVVGPWLDRSGASASITFGSSSTRFTLTEPEIDATYTDDCLDAPSAGAVWGACVTSAASPPPCGPGSASLTPADAVTLGATAVVQELLGWSDGPDLIVSGINRGGNDGLNVNISGTVGAATIGSSLGFPAIAISASSSGSSLANARAAADWSAGFVGLLAANDLLPADYILNVNYPRVDRAPITDAVWTTVAQLSPFATGYVRDGLDFQSTFAFCQPGPRCGDPEPGSDSAEYSSGKISISAVSVDRTVGAGAASATVEAIVRAGAASPVPSDLPGGRPIVVPPQR